MKSTAVQIERAIERAFNYLETRQQTNGTFPIRCLSHAGSPTTSAGSVHELPMLVILDMLQSLPDAQASRIGQKLIPWVAQQVQVQTTTNFPQSDTYSGDKSYEY